MPRKKKELVLVRVRICVSEQERGKITYVSARVFYPSVGGSLGEVPRFDFIWTGATTDLHQNSQGRPHTTSCPFPGYSMSVVVKLRSTGVTKIRFYESIHSTQNNINESNQ